MDALLIWILVAVAGIAVYLFRRSARPVTTRPEAKPEKQEPISVDLDVRDHSSERYLIEHAGELTWPGNLDRDTKGTLQGIYRRALDVKSGARGMAKGIKDAFPQITMGQATGIADADMAIALNLSALKGYQEADIDTVLVLDGSNCKDCEKADGKTISVSVAMKHPLQHVGCVRSFSPLPAGVPKSRRQDSAFAKLADRTLWESVPGGARRILGRLVKDS